MARTYVLRLLVNAASSAVNALGKPLGTSVESLYIIIILSFYRPSMLIPIRTGSAP